MARVKLDHIPLTKDVLVTGYDYICSTPPFSKWNLPEAEDILFKVARSKELRGWYRKRKGRHEIAISTNSCRYTISILKALSHEILHLHQMVSGQETSGVIHNAAFYRDAALICSIHGYDVGDF